ncbi:MULTISPECIES: type II methionyl aminopeptidase [Acidiplasma]|jgi:methionyl aminopeptidase|uniref:Methionine aminopeptidase n=2 Tax=Acidiplasma TaxID=507753 RepID=A0A0Q0VQE3_9ARCH|nr:MULTISPECIES: type II methionyl aminopeptidase [Acidiplasma]KJE49031.1 methionine aminopeptidase [Acidiplasma sp. MBA-1]KQB36046.1 methionine aminopeptidase [Acidiplasma cupricumulans]WMT54469.1 MAG: type II methionyl aminopeptidase [Acidiplasma sp.]
MDSEIKNKWLLAGKIGRKALEYAQTLIEPGALFYDVAEKTEQFIRDNGAEPSFPVNLSINNEAAHYTPFEGDKKKFKTGDLVKVDLGAMIDGYISDNAASIEVGNTGNYSDLIDSTREALNAAIKILRPMVNIYKIGEEIENVITSYGFKPVKNLGGHGINRYDLHSEIFIPNYNDGNDETIKTEKVIAIEPFASTGLGLIHNGQLGNIYIIDDTKVRDKNEIIYKNFNTVPFAERWLAKIKTDYKEYIKKMMLSRYISGFPVLKEHNKAMIAQSEHTIMILNDEIIVTTL